MLYVCPLGITTPSCQLVDWLEIGNLVSCKVIMQSSITNLSGVLVTLSTADAWWPLEHRFKSHREFKRHYVRNLGGLRNHDLTSLQNMHGMG